MIYIYIYIYIYIFIYIFIYITYFEIYIMEKHIHFFSPQFQASAQLLLQSGPLSEAQAPPRRLRGASHAPRPPMATATRNARWPWFDKPLGIGLKVRGAGGGLKVVVWCQDPKIWHLWWFFYICCWLLMIPVIFCGFIHWKNIVHPHDLWVRPTHVWHLLATNKNEMWPA